MGRVEIIFLFYSEDYVVSKIVEFRINLVRFCNYKYYLEINCDIFIIERKLCIKVVFYMVILIFVMEYVE